MGEKILLIDSTRLLSDDLCQGLEAKGYELSVVRSSKLALYKASHEHPDLIILDTTSARFNGARLCSALYQQVDAPLVASIGPKASPLECAEENVVNPISPRRFVVLIRRILKVKQP